MCGSLVKYMQRGQEVSWAQLVSEHPETSSHAKGNQKDQNQSTVARTQHHLRTPPSVRPQFATITEVYRHPRNCGWRQEKAEGPRQEKG